MKGETWVEIIKEKHILCEALSFVFPNTIVLNVKQEEKWCLIEKKLYLSSVILINDKYFISQESCTNVEKLSFLVKTMITKKI